MSGAGNFPYGNDLAHPASWAGCWFPRRFFHREVSHL